MREYITQQPQSGQSGLRICAQPHWTRQRQQWNMLRHICKHGQYSANYRDAWVPCHPTTAPIFFKAVNLFPAYASTNSSFATQCWWETSQVQRATRSSVWIWTCLDYVHLLCSSSSQSQNIPSCICKSPELTAGHHGRCTRPKTKHVGTGLLRKTTKKCK